MLEETFNAILRSIKLPQGELLADGTTYKFVKKDFPKEFDELQHFEKFLVLSDGHLNVVGGVLFYGRYDLHVIIFPEYQNRGYMSAIHKNGILKAECEQNQEVSLNLMNIHTKADFEKRVYLCSLIGATIKDVDRIKQNMWDLWE